MESLLELIQKCRSYRRFDPAFSISRQTLEELIEHARWIPSGGNLQPLKYLLSYTPETNAILRTHTRWGALLKNYQGPTEEENPSAYLVVCCDRRIANPDRCQIDVGIAAQTILLAATERGLGGCMIANMNRDAIIHAFSLPDDLQPVLVIALGKPSEQIRLETLAPGGTTAYWRDSEGLHHVPKRRTEDLCFDLTVQKSEF